MGGKKFPFYVCALKGTISCNWSVHNDPVYLQVWEIDEYRKKETLFWSERQLDMKQKEWLSKTFQKMGFSKDVFVV